MFEIKIKRTIYKVDMDKYQFILKKKTSKVNKKGETIYEVLGYFGDLKPLLKKLIHMTAYSGKKAQDFLEHMENTIKTVEEPFEEIKTKILKAIEVGSKNPEASEEE